MVAATAQVMQEYPTVRVSRRAAEINTTMAPLPDRLPLVIGTAGHRACATRTFQRSSVGRGLNPENLTNSETQAPR